MTYVDGEVACDHVTAHEGRSTDGHVHQTATLGEDREVDGRHPTRLHLSVQETWNN